ncbi:MAG TPA: 5'/3'-nucleotidase SurE [Calditrichia bacterium]|nr:5'/3'-nucleotidase SurE [Calditrichota bacterium]HQU73236.1 5'/3'-nucleotidase SurE [Calditrichia bacterium]HQV30736.1 5'/3'-nucleotidase SurE [Calditrichia bacterium]
MSPKRTNPPRILITNDDGIHAPGIMALYRAMRPLGEVHIVAPVVEKSGAAHAITMTDPLKVTRVDREDGFSGFAITGTPSDCVKLAIGGLLKFTPDLVVSGINQGDNSATNAIYSGTVAGAREGALMGAPAIAFSLASFRYRDFTLSQKIATLVAERVLREGLPEDALLNVNIPPVEPADLQGIKMASMGKSRYEDFFEERFNPQKQPYFWLQGRKITLDEDPRTDDLVVNSGYVAITPLQVDQTHYGMMDRFGDWDWPLGE